MHKSMILGLSLVSMLFLAATTGMSMQVSAIQETEKLQSFSGSKRYDDKFACRDGPLKGFYVVDPRACHVDIPVNPQLLCEECIKYWLHFINNQQNNRQVVTLINALATAINSVNFGRDTGPPGCDEENPVNPLRGVECLPIATIPQNPQTPVDVRDVAQVFDICKQLDLAIKYIAKHRDNQGNKISAQQALSIIEQRVLRITDQSTDNLVKALFDCIEESLFPQRTIIRGQEDVMFQQDDQEKTLVEPQSIDPQQQQQIEQIQEQIQQSLGQEKQQKQNTQQQNQTSDSVQPSTQQQGSSSVSQEQMHQQQIVKLKQFLESVR